MSVHQLGVKYVRLVVYVDNMYETGSVFFGCLLNIRDFVSLPPVEHRGFWIVSICWIYRALAQIHLVNVQDFGPFPLLLLVRPSRSVNTPPHVERPWAECSMKIFWKCLNTWKMIACLDIVYTRICVWINVPTVLVWAGRFDLQL